MGKNKYKRFQENLTFDNLIQPPLDESFRTNYKLKGKWGEDFFGNTNPIVLELGCGRGEYTVSLARKSPNINFIGIDIKGARIWRGAKTAIEEGMKNVGFLRTRIEFLDSFFGPNEIAEIWITFPDPQLKKGREKKRLTASGLLKMYSGFMASDGVIHLKTDSRPLHEYTKLVIAANELPTLDACDDIYGKGFADDKLSIKTTYEERFLKEGLPITYLRFGVGCKTQFVEPDIKE